MRVAGGRLLVVERDAEALALEHGTPLCVYGLQRVTEVTRALQDALGRAGLRHRVRLALKALRAPAALHVLRRLGPPATRPHHRHGALPPGERDAGRRAAGLRPGPGRGRAPGAPARGRRLPAAGGQRWRQSGDAAARRQAADRPRRLRRHPRRALRRPRCGRRRRARRVPHQRGRSSAGRGRNCGITLKDDLRRPRLRLERDERPAHLHGHEWGHVVCARAAAPPAGRVTVAGNVNEGTTSSGKMSPSPSSPRATASPWWISAATARACGPTTAAGRAPARSSSRSAPRQAVYPAWRYRPLRRFRGRKNADAPRPRRGVREHPDGCRSERQPGRCTRRVPPGHRR